MFTWITVWILTVTHTQYSSGGYGVGYAYQLQYKDQATCLAEAKKHQARKIVKEGLINTITYVNPYKRARCDKHQIVVGTSK
jgi:hypothetical protein